MEREPPWFIAFALFCSVNTPTRPISIIPMWYHGTELGKFKLATACSGQPSLNYLDWLEKDVVASQSFFPVLL